MYRNQTSKHLFLVQPCVVQVPENFLYDPHFDSNPEQAFHNALVNTNAQVGAAIMVASSFCIAAVLSHIIQTKTIKQTRM